VIGVVTPAGGPANGYVAASVVLLKRTAANKYTVNSTVRDACHATEVGSFGAVLVSAAHSQREDQ